MASEWPKIQDNAQADYFRYEIFYLYGMATFSTRNALSQLLNKEDYLLTFLKAGYTKDDRSRFRNRLKNEELSLDKMEEILVKCGFRVAQEKKWTKPI